jgi:hypothetical protein
MLWRQALKRPGRYCCGGGFTFRSDMRGLDKWMTNGLWSQGPEVHSRYCCLHLHHLPDRGDLSYAHWWVRPLPIGPRLSNTLPRWLSGLDTLSYRGYDSNAHRRGRPLLIGPMLRKLVTHYHSHWLPVLRHLLYGGYCDLLSSLSYWLPALRLPIGSNHCNIWSSHWLPVYLLYRTILSALKLPLTCSLDHVQ